MTHFRDKVKEILEGKYDVKFIEDDPWGCAKFVEMHNFEFELLPGENFIEKFFNKFDEEDYEIEEYYFNYSIALVISGNYDDEPEEIKLLEGNIIDELSETHELNKEEIKEKVYDDIEPGKYKFEYVGINCFYGKYRGYIDVDDLNEAFEDNFNDFDEIENEKDFAQVVDNVLIENYEWTFEDIPSQCDIYCVFKKE